MSVCRAAELIVGCHGVPVFSRCSLDYFISTICTAYGIGIENEDRR